MMGMLFGLLKIDVCETCTEADERYFSASREGIFGGKRLKDVPQTGPELEADMTAFAKAPDDVASWIDAQEIV